MTMGRSKTTLDPAVELLSDKYEVLDILGGGGMGRVYRARHRQLKRLVAIKLLHEHIGGDESVARFLREARSAAQIASSHVAHVMDAGVLPNGNPYIVMEYLQGRDLARWVREEGRLPVTQAVDFMLQALEALAEAHALRIVHRDIKPDNLFATRGSGGDTLIKVLDFGLAKAGPAVAQTVPDITERGVMLGTPRYMAPEQFSDAQQADVRSDLWAFGATLFELLTGVPPFSGDNLPQIYRAVMHRSIPTIRSLVPELPEGLERVVATCLTRERELRFADAAELSAALRPWAGPASLERVERIQRIVDRAGHAPASADEPSARGASLPSSPAPTPAAGAGIAPATRRRLPWIALGLGVVSGSGFLWIVDSQPAHAPSPGRERSRAVAPSQEPATRETSIGAIRALPQPDAAAAEHVAAEAVAPRTPLQPTAAPEAKPSKRDRHRTPGREAARENTATPAPGDRTSAYEEYP